MTAMHALIAAAVSLVGLGLVFGFSPSTAAITLHLLTASKGAARSITWMSVGLALGATLYLLLFRIVDPETLTALARTDAQRLLVRRGVDLVAGLLLLAAALVVARSARRRPPRKTRPPHRETSLRMVAIGAGEALSSISGMATMYITGRVITAATHAISLQILEYAVFLAALTGPYLLAARAWRALPRLARHITELSDRLASADLRPWVAAGLALAGIVFLGLGVFGHRA
jgi:cytochrome c biogenesis protein CcdA